jgi:hypothetical protein
LQASVSSVSDVSSGCCKCFVFDVAHVEMTIYACFKMFVLNISYVSSDVHCEYFIGRCICFTRILQKFYVDVTYLCNDFSRVSKCFASVSDACCKCLNWMFQSRSQCCTCCNVTCPTTTKSGQNTRYPLPIPELPEPGPELPEPEVPDPKFGYRFWLPKISLGNSGNIPRYPNYPNYPNIYFCLSIYHMLLVEHFHLLLY